MFGARGPLLSPEDGGGTGAAGATTTDGGTGQAATTTTAGGDAGKTFTQAELDKIVTERLQKDRASRTQQTQQQTTTTKPAGDDGGEKLTLKELSARLEASEARRAFDRRVGKLGLDEDVADDLFALSQLQKPGDLGVWLEQKSKLYGSGAAKGSEAAGTTQDTTQQSTAATGKTGAAATGGAPAKVETPTVGGVVDIWHLTVDQIAALGPQGLRDAHEKILASARQSNGAPSIPAVLRKR